MEPATRDTLSARGVLYVVATPIGHLEDITFRAVNILKEADIIAAEDTRHSKKLLSHYGISTPLISCHEHNETDRTPDFIARLQEGKQIALICDAGTPCISDPGYNLVKAAAQAGIRVIPIPGCSAAIAGLSVSGLPTDSFLFSGFLPKKEQQLEQALEKLKTLTPTLIIYESPKRIKKLIRRIIPVFGDRQACLAREITKIHEEFIRDSLSGILEALEQKEQVKGEISLFIQGSSTKAAPLDNKALEAIIKKRLSDDDPGTATLAREISEQYPVKKKQVYDLIVKLRCPNC